MRLSEAGLLLASAILLLAPSARASALKAGVAKVDITPPPGLPLWGYELRDATGTLDPLFARVLVLEVGEKRVALVALDLGRTFGRGSIEQIREAARKSSGISYVLVCATHDHSAPAIRDSYPQGLPPWEQAALEKVEKAIHEAHEHAVEARLGTGYGDAYIGHNRLRLNPDGTVTWFANNETQIPTSPVDPTVSVLRLDTLNGNPIAIVVNYACHPVVFGPDNRQYSADYPAATVKTVQDSLGDQPLCIFLQGAPGDINPYYTAIPLKQDAVKRRDWEGTQLGEVAARIAREIHTQSPPHPSLDFAEDLLAFHFRWNADKYRKAFFLSSEVSSNSAAAFYYFPPTDSEQQLPVATLLLNRQIAFMSMPGEPFVEFQINWRQRCPVSDCFFLGYANGYFGYLPTIHASTQGGYGAASLSTWIEPGAGERMVDHAILRVYQMLGLLSDSPENPDEDYTRTRPRQAEAASR
jgi:neutral ceramidase